MVEPSSSVPARTAPVVTTVPRSTPPAALSTAPARRRARIGLLLAAAVLLGSTGTALSEAPRGAVSTPVAAVAATVTPPLPPPAGGDHQPGNGARSGGDGCRPYEHRLPGGWCSPDTGVLDENGNLDPARAVVPGNLR